jgi:hypothetical protein
MCTIWGYAQGWWTVAGLVADILGFTLLALDLSREYIRHRRSVSLAEGAEAAEWLIQHRDNQVDTSDAEKRKLRQELAELKQRINYGLMRSAEILSDPSGKVAALNRLEDKIGAFRTLAKEVAARPFKRGPIFTGIFFVILGFVLQVVGAIPCT